MSIEADPIDQASTVTQESTQREIDAASVDTSNASGECLYCGDEIGYERRWCDADCCKEWVRVIDILPALKERGFP